MAGHVLYAGVLRCLQLGKGWGSDVAVALDRVRVLSAAVLRGSVAMKDA